MNMSTLAILLLLVFIAIAVSRLKRQKAEARLKPPEFFGKTPLTQTEQVLYHRLVKALPDCLILAQVQISQLVGIKTGPLWQGWFNKISRKSADFVVCLNDFTVVCVIELDDRTHEREDRKQGDADKDTALTGAGYNIMRWRARDMPSIEAIHKAIYR